MSCFDGLDACITRIDSLVSFANFFTSFFEFRKVFNGAFKLIGALAFLTIWNFLQCIGCFCVESSCGFLACMSLLRSKDPEISLTRLNGDPHLSIGATTNCTGGLGFI